jgi:hypothetical protein
MPSRDVADRLRALEYSDQLTVAAALELASIRAEVESVAKEMSSACCLGYLVPLGATDIYKFCKRLAPTRLRRR